MSHFTVLVVTSSKPTDKVLEKALMPFHEFECTGFDQYVVDVDDTEELREQYHERTLPRMKLPDGSHVGAYDDRFYREPTAEELAQHLGGSGCMTLNGKSISYHSKDWGDGRGYRVKVRFVPEGHEEISVPCSEIETFAEFAKNWTGRNAKKVDEELDLEGEHRYGYIEVDAAGEVVRCIRRTNPNAKWDWYLLGGRWTGMLRSKSGEGLVGDRGLMTDRAAKGTFDAVQRSDLDLDAMRLDAIGERRKRVQAIMDKAKATFSEVEAAAHAYPKMRAAWLALEERPRGLEYDVWQTNAGFKAFKHIWKTEFFGFIELPEDQTLDQWIHAAPAFSTFAVLKDGQWFEKGEMGWFGCVSNEKADWSEDFNRLFDDIHPDHWVAVVDCHI